MNGFRKKKPQLIPVVDQSSTSPFSFRKGSSFTGGATAGKTVPINRRRMNRKITNRLKELLQTGQFPLRAIRLQKHLW